MSLVIKVKSETDAIAFEKRVVPILTRREAENCLPISIVMRSARWKGEGKVEQAAKTKLWSIEQDGNLVGMASLTMPHNLVITKMESAVLWQLVQSLRTEGVKLPGVVGPSAAADEFARAWCQASGEKLEKGKGLGIYELREVQKGSDPAGRFREAGRGDLEIVAAWWEAFAGEIGEPLATSAKAEAEQAIADRRIYVWEKEGEAVSMAGWGGATTNGVRIMLVYTPGKNRRKGYASATVAALSQRMLDNGRKACFLFTDLANPTSNHIYQEIGYGFVGECRQWKF